MDYVNPFHVLHRLESNSILKRGSKEQNDKEIKYTTSRKNICSRYESICLWESGMLHRAVGDTYELRDGQMRMAVAVGRAILGRNILLCEGATGIGKSFGYLIPAFSPNTRKIRETIEESPIRFMILTTKDPPNPSPSTWKPQTSEKRKIPTAQLKSKKPLLILEVRKLTINVDSEIYGTDHKQRTKQSCPTLAYR